MFSDALLWLGYVKLVSFLSVYPSDQSRDATPRMRVCVILKCNFISRLQQLLQLGIMIYIYVFWVPRC